MTRLGDWAGTSDLMVHSLSNYFFLSTNRITNGTPDRQTGFFFEIQTGSGHMFLAEKRLALDFISVRTAGNRQPRTIK